LRSMSMHAGNHFRSAHIAMNIEDEWN
jgi:hypothetical protein